MFLPYLGHFIFSNFTNRISINLFQRSSQDSQNRQLNSKRSRTNLRSPSMSSEVDGGDTQEHGLRLLQSMVLLAVIFISILRVADF